METEDTPFFRNLRESFTGDQKQGSLTSKIPALLQTRKPELLDIFGGPLREHRQEVIYPEYGGGLIFINDSKSEDPGDTHRTMINCKELYPGNRIIWLGCSYNPIGDYSSLIPVAKETLDGVIAIGNSITGQLRFQQNIAHAVPFIFNTQSIDEGVRVAIHWAKKGNLILWSPAGRGELDFEERGNTFATAVRKWAA